MPSMIHVAKEWGRRGPFTPPNIRAGRENASRKIHVRFTHPPKDGSQRSRTRNLAFVLLAVVDLDPREVETSAANFKLTLNHELGTIERDRRASAKLERIRAGKLSGIRATVQRNDRARDRNYYYRAAPVVSACNKNWRLSSVSIIRERYYARDS